jgi:hypothetical protein
MQLAVAVRRVDCMLSVPVRVDVAVDVVITCRCPGKAHCLAGV